MSIYLRKSIKAGPLRLNLSKSGIGFSTGIPGLRVGTGPRGSYVRMGRGGVYYRKTLSSKATRHRPALVPAPHLELATDDVVMHDVTGARLQELTEATSSDVLHQLNDAARRHSLTFFVVLLCLPVVTIPLALWVRAKDKARRTVVVFYDVDGPAATYFQTFINAFGYAEQCARAWYVTAQGDITDTYQWKTHSGASRLLRRDEGTTGQQGPTTLATNIRVPSLHAGTRSLHFLPDRILIREQRRFAEVRYRDCLVHASPTRFIEEGPIPRDSTQVDTTWRYVNKGGGPDRRFNNNRRIPILNYGQLILRSPQGFQFIWQTSTPLGAKAIADGIAAMQALG